MHRAHTVVDSPVGPLTLVALDGALTGLYMDRQLYRPQEATFGDRDPSPSARRRSSLRSTSRAAVRSSTCRSRSSARRSSARYGTPC